MSYGHAEVNYGRSVGYRAYLTITQPLSILMRKNLQDGQLSFIFPYIVFVEQT